MQRPCRLIRPPSVEPSVDGWTAAAGTDADPRRFERVDAPWIDIARSTGDDRAVAGSVHIAPGSITVITPTSTLFIVFKHLREYALKVLEMTWFSCIHDYF
jgi:hypothetical protein